MATNKPVIAVWFSCGAASAVAAHETIRRYGGTHEIRVVNNPVVEEDADNIRFANDVSEWLGVDIETAVNSKYPGASAVEVWDRRGFMSGPLGAPCTTELKKVARQQWEAANRPDFHVLGFTADERTRHERFVMTERDNVLPVLIEAGITKADCYRILKDAGLRLPKIYEMGYPNANCIGCEGYEPHLLEPRTGETPGTVQTAGRTKSKVGSKTGAIQGGAHIPRRAAARCQGKAHENHAGRVWDFL